MMIKISSGNAAFDLGFMHEMRMQGWTKKQASVMLDYALQFSNGQDMVKAASAGIIPEDPEANPIAFVKWAASARERYAWCNMTKYASQQSPSWDEIGGQFSQAGSSALDAMRNAGTGMMQTGRKAWNDYIQPGIEKFKKINTPIWMPGGPLGPGSQIGGWIGEKAQQGWDAAKDFARNVPTYVGKGIGYAQNGWDATKQWAGDTWDAAKQGVSDAWDATKGYVRDAAGAVGRGVGHVVNTAENIYNKGKDLVNRGVEAGKNVARGVGNFFGGLWNKTKELAGRGVDKVKQWYNDGSEAVSQGIDAAKQWGRDTYNAGREAVGRGIDTAKQWGQDAIDAGRRGIEAAGDYAAGVGRDIRDFAGRQIDKGVAGYNEVRGLNKSSSALYNWYFNRY